MKKFTATLFLLAIGVHGASDQIDIHATNPQTTFLIDVLKDCTLTKSI